MVVTLIFGSVASFAAEGDYIHTGKKKYYGKDDTGALVDDILSGFNINEFYRESADGSYVNLKKEEDAQLAYLRGLVEKSNGAIASEAELQAYISENEITIKNDFNNITSGLATVFDKISDVPLKDYIGNPGSTLPKNLTNPKDYSIPIPGSKDGTTKIETLVFPTGSSQWLYDILDEPLKDLTFNQEVTGTSYTAGVDIEIAAGKYIGLYATDRTNRLKAYASIEVKDGMVRKAASLVEDATVAKSTEIANAVKISDVPAGNWSYFVRTSKLANVYVDNRFNDAATFDTNKDIVVADEDTVIDDNFKKFVYLISSSENGDIDKYYVFEVSKDLVSQAPLKLMVDTHYVGPVKGINDKKTQFSKLDFEGNAFRYVKSNSPIPIPALGADYSSIGTVLNSGDGIEALAGESLLLVAVDGSKVVGYERFLLNEDQIKGITPTSITFTPGKGNGPGTTMVKGLTLSGEANKWMYAIGKNLPEPALDRVYPGAKEYTLGADIKAEDGQTLMLFETDSSGKVKMAGKFTFNESVDSRIKAALAYNMALDKNAYLKDPIKGGEAGTIKFDLLRYDGLKFKYMVSKDIIPVPEKDGKSSWEDITIDDKGIGTEDIVLNIGIDELKADDGFKYNMMIVAVNGAEEVQAYYGFELSRNNVRLPKAEKLNQVIEGSKIENYSEPVKGDSQSSTKIMKLDKGFLSKVSGFRYKVIDSPMIIEYNTVITGAPELKENATIQGKLGQHLLILAVDLSGRTKYYEIVKLDDKNLRNPNALFLSKGTHFDEPIPGEGDNSTRIHLKQLPDGATEWMYKISDTANNSIEANVTMAGAKELVSDTDIIEDVKVNKWITILATDDAGNVKYFHNHRLVDTNIRGGKAEGLIPGLDYNYVISKGSKPGTTQFTWLDGLGLPNASATRWKYKLVETEPTDVKDKPYLGSVVAGASNFFNINTDIKITPYSDGSYGYLLLLATDGNGKTKGYAYIKLDGNHVKEHAPRITGASIIPGGGIDTTEVNGLDGGKIYKYIIGTRAFDTPSIGDFLPINHKDYAVGGDIKVKFGDHLTIFELDGDGNIAKFAPFIINADANPKVVNQGSGVFSLSSPSTLPNTLLEGEINNGGKKLSISLTGASWIDGLDKNPDLRNKLYKGLISNNQSGEWTKVVAALIDDGFGNIGVSGNNLTISLVKASDYNIVEEQEITMVIHPDLIKDAMNPIYTTGELIIKPTVRANISGDVVTELVRAKDLKDGGKTIIIDLVDGNWKIDVDESKLLPGLVSDGGEGGNWNKIVTAFQPGNINRESSTRVTITLPKVDGFAWDGTKSETITVKIDPTLLIDATEEVVASPTFTLYPDILKVIGKTIVDGEPTNEVLLKAPDGKEIRGDSNKWKIAVETGTLREDLSSSDLLISGLPKGLVATATKSAEGNIIDIVVSGTSATKITDSQVFVSIKGSAVTEPNSAASDAIELRLKLAKEMDLNSVSYKVEGKFLRFTGISADMEYSSSLDGIWHLGTGSEVPLSLEPMKVTVREMLQPKVIKVFEFTNGDAPTGVSISKYNYITGELHLSGVNDTMEYSLNGGESYTSIAAENTVIHFDAKTDLRVRDKALNTDTATKEVGKLPSKPTAKLNGQYLGDVVLAAGEGKILNTNADMGYSLGSSNGTDGTWENARAKETLVTFAVGNKVWIRDNKDIKNFRELGTIKQADKPDLDEVDFDISLGIIENKLDLDLEYIMTGDKWETVAKNTIKPGVVFKAGALEFRVKAVGDILASPVVQKETVIKAMKSKPVVEIDDVENKVLSINGIVADWEAFEYRVNPTTTTPWTPGNELKSADLSGEKTVQIRFKAEQYVLYSDTESVKFTKNLELSHVVLSDYANPPVLNGTTAVMEYQIVTVNSTTPWTKASTPLPSWFKDYWNNGLIVSVAVRDGRVGQQNNVHPVVEPNDSNDDARFDKISYEFKDSKVIFSGVSSSMEYSKDDKIWTLGNGANIEFGDEPINLRVRLKDLTYVFKEFKIDRDAAPTGIKIKSYSYDDGKLELDGFTSDMEYSIDGGTTWTPYTSDPIDVDANTNLKARYSFKGGTSDTGSLSSLPSNKINNAVYLGNVEVDADNQKLLKTNNLMEYSIDSTDGKDGTWKPTHSTLTETNVALKLNDSVWIREKNNTINVREIGKVEKELKPSLDKVYFDISATKIYNGSDQDLEYTIDGTNWIKIGAKKDTLDVVFKAGKLEFRKQGKGINFASDPVTKKNLVEPNAPEVKAVYDTVKKIQYYDGTSWNDLDNNIQYRVGANGKWKLGGMFGSDTAVNGNTIVYFRKAATRENIPSKETSLTLIFVDLKLNVAGKKIDGVSTKMEYSLNSTDGTNGNWTPVTSNIGSVSIDFIEGMSIWFREKDNHSMKIKLLDKIWREDEPDLTVEPYKSNLSYNVTDGQIINGTDNNLEYKMPGKDIWEKLNANSIASPVQFVPGLIQIRKAPTDEKLSSHSVTFATIKARASAPIVSHDDVTNKVISIDSSSLNWNIYEYRTIYKGVTSPWISGDFLGEENLSDNRKLEIQVKATKDYLPSQIAKVDFTPNLQLDHVRLSVTINGIELNGTTDQMQYKVWLSNGTSTWAFEDWKICDDTNNNTKLDSTLLLTGPIHIERIEIRDSKQHLNSVTVYPQP